MINPIIAIEGLSYSGKTTIFNILNNLGFDSVPELASFCNDGMDFPPLPTNINEAVESDNWFQQMEEYRCNEALKKQLQKKVVADRWFISSTGYVFARDVLLGNDTLEYQIKGIKKRMEEGCLFIPYFVYLCTDIDTVKKRYHIFRQQYGGVELRGSLMVDQYRNDFFALQKYFYDLFSDIYHDRVLKLNNTDDNNKNLSDILTWSEAIDSSILHSAEEYMHLVDILIAKRNSFRSRGT